MGHYWPLDVDGPFCLRFLAVVIRVRFTENLEPSLTIRTFLLDAAHASVD
jgi:hypothetical protein